MERPPWIHFLQKNANHFGRTFVRDFTELLLKEERNLIGLPILLPLLKKAHNLSGAFTYTENTALSVHDLKSCLTTVKTLFS